MPDEPIYDAKGTLIEVGDHVLPVVREGRIVVPAGKVTKITEPDVDFNDDTGRPEAYGPFVYVLYEDGEEDRWTAYDKRGGFDEPSEYVCDEIEISVFAKTPTEEPRQWNPNIVVPVVTLLLFSPLLLDRLL